MDGLDLCCEYRESDYSMPGAVLWDSDDYLPNFSHQEMDAYEPISVFSHHPSSAVNIDTYTAQDRPLFGSFRLQECSKPAETALDADSAAGSGYWPLIGDSSLEHSQIQVSEFEQAPLLRNDVEVFIYQDFPGSDNNTEMASGLSRSTTPALSFSTSRSSSRSPSMYDHSETSFLHPGYIAPLPGTHTEDALSTGTESLLEDTLAVQPYTDRDFSIVLPSVDFPRERSALLDSRSEYIFPDCYVSFSPPPQTISDSHSEYIFPGCHDSSSPPPPALRSVSPSNPQTDTTGEHEALTPTIPRSSPSLPPRSRRMIASSRVVKQSRGSRTRRKLFGLAEYYSDAPDDSEDDDTYNPNKVEPTSSKKGRVHSASEPIEERLCDECGMVFTRAADMARHHLAAHSEMSEDMKKQSTCVLCLKVLARPDAMKRHLGTQTRKCLLVAKRRVASGELSSEVYHHYISSPLPW
ncbi:hypothetical protein GYMLUDRAFT_69882 [Collybiopsis luxurians FD-317 M1]|nr:hypothetical protein GYMLUDRAFT_69882 [Collybiopsis luxurians FD-317 M1]